MTAPIRSTPAYTHGDARAWVLLPAAAMLLQAGALVLLAGDHVLWASDQINYHAVAIAQFVDQWPAPDIVNYPSATSPGWHLLLAALMKAGAGIQGLRWMSVAAGVALMLAATTTAARWVSPRTAALATLPLAFSPYAVGGSAWITTDVPALACIALSLSAVLAGLAVAHGTLLQRPARTKDGKPTEQWKLWVGALWATAGVAVRQPVAWLAAPIAWRAMLERRWTAVAAALLPVALLAGLTIMWADKDGIHLMPPKYRYLHDHGINPAGLLVFLALGACWGGPYAAALLWSEWKARSGGFGRMLRAGALGGVGGLVAACAIASSFNQDAGRCFGPIWQVIERVDAKVGAPADRSWVMLVLVPLGAASIAALARAAARRGASALASIVLLSMALAAAANVANSQAWERYADLPLLLLLPWLAVLGVADTRAARAVGTAAVLVTVMQLGIASVNLWKPALTPPPAGATP